MAMQLGLPWHDGEIAIHKRIGGPERDNPTNPALTQHAAIRLQQAPLLAVGTLDAQGRPWTAVWGGKPGFAAPLGSSMIGMKVDVDEVHDPVVQALCNDKSQGVDGGQLQRGAGKMISGLTMDLDRRNRIKLCGRLVAGSLVSKAPSDPENSPSVAQGQIQLVTKIDQSLGNCPKYLNRKDIQPSALSPKLISDSAALSSEATKLIAKADLFFMSSSNGHSDMDTNHRGGHAGFVRVRQTSDSQHQILWPEYSGNRLYQTLGNLEVTPLAGLVFPDFDTGDVLYLTGQTRTLVGREANALLPRSNLAVELTVTRSLFVQQGLSFRGTPLEHSPYNPKVRPLATENRIDIDASNTAANSAKLLAQTVITPSISRFTFTMSNPTTYKAGQWVAFDFSDEMDVGYSHMCDDDPQSINDDFVRTFTVSSPPPPKKDLADDSFEVTIRRIGAVTGFLFKQQARHGLEIPMRGFGGDYVIKQNTADDGVITPFVAGGVGITPLLATLYRLDLRRLRLFWTLPSEDANLVVDTLQRHSGLAASTRVFLTGAASESNKERAVESLRGLGVSCVARRLVREDLFVEGGTEMEMGKKWYVCASTGLRKSLGEWLDGEGRELVFEDFNF